MLSVFSSCLPLIAILLLGTLLRFWHLDSKPLWMDEVITALFSLGHSYQDIPLEQVIPISGFDPIGQLTPTTCQQIAQTVSSQSVHPPLFFCGLHQWLQWLQPWPQSWIWKLRSLPALLGVSQIAAVYGLNRIAFSPRAGLMAAIAMAVSPFAVYLSQEARHYSLPMLLILLALTVLIRLQQDVQVQRRTRPWLWGVWIALNSLGFYVHYFFALAIGAQVLTLISLELYDSRRRPPISPDRPLSRPRYWSLGLAVLGLALTLLPWLPTFLSHSSRPETDWLQVGSAGWLSWINPIGQLVAGVLVMTIALPVEHQPLWIALPAGLLMVVVGLGLGWRVWLGIRQRWRDPATHRATLMLVSVVAWTLVIFLGIIYGLRKDITQVPRYNFIYYPAVCALIGAGLSTPIEPRSKFKLHRSVVILLIAGLLSCLLMGTNQVFTKPYRPEKIAADILQSRSNFGSGATIVVMTYETFQDIALASSFVLALRDQAARSVNASAPVQIALVGPLRDASGTPYVPWSKLVNLKGQTVLPQQTWLIAPRLRQREFPPTLTWKQSECKLQRDRYYRIGIPYQGYQCQASDRTAS